MKAVRIVKPEQLELIEVEKPVINEKDNVLIRMTAAGICGSDVGIYHAPTPPPPIPASSATRWWAWWTRWVPTSRI